MKKYRLPIFVLVLVMVLEAGCIMNPAGTRKIYLMPKPYSEMPADSKNAVVTFYRKNVFAGAGTSFYVRDKNGRTIGGMITNAYFSLKLPPGIHTFTVVTAQGTADYSIRLEPNKSYFIKGDTVSMAHGPLGLLTIVSAEEGRADLSKLKNMTVLENVEGYGPDENTHWLN